MNPVIFEDKEIIPNRIFCIGLNYNMHAEEMSIEAPSEPVVFIKPNSSISDCIRLNIFEELEYECELCFLLKKQEIAGVGLGLDLTNRKLQSILMKKGLPWERSKSFVGSAVFSKFLRIDSSINELSFKFFKNSQKVQHAHIDEMIFKPNELIKSIGDEFSICENDILMTGTPKGVGSISKNDLYKMELFKGSQKIISKEILVQ